MSIVLARILRANGMSFTISLMTTSAFSPLYPFVTKALVEMRTKAKFTQRDLAALLRRERSFISRLETGQRRIDLVEFFWICEACKVDAATAAGELYQVFRKAGRAS